MSRARDDLEGLRTCDQCCWAGCQCPCHEGYAAFFERILSDEQARIGDGCLVAGAELAEVLERALMARVREAAQ